MSTYDEVSTTTRKAIITKAVNAASELLAVGRTDLAVEILFAPRVVRAANHLLKDGHQVSVAERTPAEEDLLAVESLGVWPVPDDTAAAGREADIDLGTYASALEEVSPLLGDTQERRWKGDEVVVIDNPWRSHQKLADFGHVHDQFGRCWKRRAAPMPCEPERDSKLHAYDDLMNCSACGHAHVGPDTDKNATVCNPSGWWR